MHANKKNKTNTIFTEIKASYTVTITDYTN